MKYLIIILTMTYAEAHSQNFNHQVSKKGIKFSWSIKNNMLHCQVDAPLNGWVAVGFNDLPGLKGTNLIIGAVKEEFYHFSDRFIISPGNHQSILALGGDEQLKNRMGYEKDNGTTLSFSIPLALKDRYHINLTEGNEYYLLLAYSTHDDFSHHSLVRTSLKITL